MDLEHSPLHAAAADLVRYREGVETLMRIKSPATISNGQPSHAAILFETFFKHCAEQVLIFCKNLNAQVFSDPDLVNAAAWALAQGKKIRVITQEPPQSSPFLDLVKKDVCLADPITARADFNFAVMDTTALRYEPQKSTCTATATMYNPSLAKMWARFFERAELLSQPLITAA